MVEALAEVAVVAVPAAHLEALRVVQVAAVVAVVAAVPVVLAVAPVVEVARPATLAAQRPLVPALGLPTAEAATMPAGPQLLTDLAHAPLAALPPTSSAVQP